MRVIQKPSARFYVKGSFVLDFVFGRNFARDVDVFFDETTARPRPADVHAWLHQKRLPPAKSVDVHPVGEFDSCSGGGYPMVNFERWHLRHDGLLYTIEKTDGPSGVLPLWGQTAMKTRPIPLSCADARAAGIVVLRPVDEVSRDADGLKYVTKLLEKMVNHPELRDAALEATLRDVRQEIERELAAARDDER